MPTGVLPNLDNAVHRFGERLLDCLCDQVDATIGGPVCRCCPVPGDLIVQDSCCDCGTGNGQAGIRVVQIYPTSSFPSQIVEPGPCSAVSWAVVYELVVDRCVETMRDDGTPPDCSTLTWQARMQADDMAALRKVALCCFRRRDDPCAGGTVVPGPITPVGPSGNCLRSAMTITVAFSDCCEDDES